MVGGCLRLGYRVLFGTGRCRGLLLFAGFGSGCMFLVLPWLFGGERDGEGDGIAGAEKPSVCKAFFNQKSQSSRLDHKLFLNEAFLLGWELF